MEKEILQLKIDMGAVKNDMQHVKSEQGELKENMKDGFKEVIDKIDCLDQKFSAKWVEKIILWAAAIIGFALLSGLITLVWKTAVHFAGK